MLTRLHSACHPACPAPPWQARSSAACLPTPSARAPRNGSGAAAAAACATRPQPRQHTRLAAAAAAAAQPSSPSGDDDGTEALLLDLLLPAPPAAVAAAIFGSAALAPSGATQGDGDGLLARFFADSLGYLQLSAGAWQAAGEGAAATRRVAYASPLSPRQRLLLPFGPAAVACTDEQRLMHGSGGSVTVSSRCTSQGVPFADCFANRLEWRLEPGAGGTATRVLLSARCTFHRPVLGPLRGQIERESLQASRAWGGVLA